MKKLNKKLMVVAVVLGGFVGPNLYAESYCEKQCSGKSGTDYDNCMKWCF